MAKKQNKAEANASKTEEKKPKARKTAKKAEKQQNLEDILFECRNKLRGNANMTTKRDMLLTLVFLRLICSRFNEQKEKIKSDVLTNLGKAEDALSAEERDFVTMMQENKSSFEQDGVFYLQDGYNWEQLVTLPASERAIALDNGITQLMEAEKNLKNALPANLFVNARLEPSVLKGVMDDINKIDPRNFKDIDLIGRVYEYFLQQFAVNATKEDGEFYTPQSIVELIAHLIEPYDGTIYDPCCGSGGMFVQSVRLIEAHGGNKRNVSVYGQESDPDTYRLAKMNLAARGISYHLGDSNASSFTNDKHPDLRANYIMANPPFNLKAWRTEEQLTKDIRWSGYGLPPVSNANYAWILHMLYHLDTANGIAGFLLSNGALEDEDTLAIREQLIRNDKVEAIFILPREMFYSTDTSVTLWILNQNKKGGIRNGRQLRNRENEVLFVDLRTWNQNNSTIKTDKSKKTFVVFNEEQIKTICDIYHGWQTYTEMEAYDKPELYHAAYIDEIEANGWSLTPSRYIKFEDKSVILHKKNIINNTISIIDDVHNKMSDLNYKFETIKSEVSILDAISSYPLHIIGDFIELVDERNTGNKQIEVCGINKTKAFMPTVADLTGVDISKYKVVKKGYFAFSGMQTGRDICIRIALYNDINPILISPAYTTFKLNTNKILPEFFLLFFKRDEMDRYGWFISDSSVRANLDWPRFLAIRIPLPPIDVQRAIVNIYHCAEEAKRIAEEADRLSCEICPALMQHIIHEADDCERTRSQSARESE